MDAFSLSFSWVARSGKGNSMGVSLQQKMPRTPPGPPTWSEGPQIPTPAQLVSLGAWKAKQASTDEALEQMARVGVILVPIPDDLDAPYLEHLPGKHDQKTHGNKYGKADDGSKV